MRPPNSQHFAIHRGGGDTRSVTYACRPTFRRPGLSNERAWKIDSASVVHLAATCTHAALYESKTLLLRVAEVRCVHGMV